MVRQVGYAVAVVISHVEAWARRIDAKLPPAKHGDCPLCGGAMHPDGDQPSRSGLLWLRCVTCRRALSGRLFDRRAA